MKNFFFFFINKDFTRRFWKGSYLRDLNISAWINVWYIFIGFLSAKSTCLHALCLSSLTNTSSRKIPLDRAPVAEKERLSRVLRDRTYTKALGNSSRIRFAKLANGYEDGWKSSALVSDGTTKDVREVSELSSFLLSRMPLQSLKSSFAEQHFDRTLAFVPQFSKLILNFELLKSS